MRDLVIQTTAKNDATTLGGTKNAWRERYLIVLAKGWV